jgi:hypothetical protein
MIDVLPGKKGCLDYRSGRVAQIETGRFAHWLNLLDKGRLDQGCAFLPTWD